VTRKRKIIIDTYRQYSVQQASLGLKWFMHESGNSFFT
jgi:hypothetical protein